MSPSSGDRGGRGGRGGCGARCLDAGHSDPAQGGAVDQRNTDDDIDRVDGLARAGAGADADAGAALVARSGGDGGVAALALRGHAADAHVCGGSDHGSGASSLVTARISVPPLPSCSVTDLIRLLRTSSRKSE